MRAYLRGLSDLKLVRNRARVGRAYGIEECRERYRRLEALGLRATRDLDPKQKQWVRLGKLAARWRQRASDAR